MAAAGTSASTAFGAVAAVASMVAGAVGDVATAASVVADVQTGDPTTSVRGASWGSVASFAMALWGRALLPAASGFPPERFAGYTAAHWAWQLFCKTRIM